ncbi:MAG: hypothetical protein ACKV2T_35310 [Kofleriaceae bacterium]
MEKPSHLRPADPSAGSWLAQRPAAVAAGVLGLVAFIVVAIASGELGATPDWRLSVPGFALTAIASIASIARKERGGYMIWMIGLGLAAASLVLGWFLMVAIVIGAAVLAVLILHAIF